VTEENSIIDEIRQTRENLLAKHNGDIDALVTHLQESSKARLRSGQSGIVSPEQPNLRESVVRKKRSVRSAGGITFFGCFIVIMPKAVEAHE
jgi:hypothetical protein